MKDRFTTTSNKDTTSTSAVVTQSKQQKPQQQPQDDDAPWRKALTRSLASFGTWFITEYPKLIFQQQRQQQQHSSNKYPLISTIQIYRSTSWYNHLRGALSSAAQRGSSAMIMFYGQAYISQALVQLAFEKSNNNRNTQTRKNDWKTAGVAGFLGGACSSLVHTLFEPIKIRHAPFCWNVYRASLWPMMWRHALFDGTFFATSALLESYNQQHNDSNHATDPQPKQPHVLSYATIFGVSALAASTVNLTHDLWKTQFIKALPHRLKWMSVVKSLSVSSFRQQWIMKAADLGFNWWVTGLLYTSLFAGKPQSQYLQLQGIR